MKLKVIKLTFILGLTYKILGMSNPIDRYKQQLFASLTPLNFPDSISTVILDYSKVLIYLIDKTSQKIPHPLIEFEMTPNVCIIDLKYVFSRRLQIPTRSFRFVLDEANPENDTFESNPLVPVISKSLNKFIWIIQQTPTPMIQRRSCKTCNYYHMYSKKTVFINPPIKHDSFCFYEKV